MEFNINSAKKYYGNSLQYGGFITFVLCFLLVIFIFGGFFIIFLYLSLVLICNYIMVLLYAIYSTDTYNNKDILLSKT